MVLLGILWGFMCKLIRKFVKVFGDLFSRWCQRQYSRSFSSFIFGIVNFRILLIQVLLLRGVSGKGGSFCLLVFCFFDLVLFEKQFFGGFGVFVDVKYCMLDFGVILYLGIFSVGWVYLGVDYSVGKMQEYWFVIWKWNI